MAFYLVSVSAGNLFVSGVNLFIQNADGSSRLPGASYYWFFALLMLGVFGIYLLVSRHFKEQTYIQGEA
jgi:POT family proton-dependent oligopeptide transporter